MTDPDIIIGIALEEACLSLEQLAAAIAVEPDWIAHRVAEGLVPARGDSRSGWRFTARALARARRMRALERDFAAVPELAALVADLLEEMDELRASLR